MGSHCTFTMGRACIASREEIILGLRRRIEPLPLPLPELEALDDAADAEEEEEDDDEEEVVESAAKDEDPSTVEPPPLPPPTAEAEAEALPTLLFFKARIASGAIEKS